jgi:hypothetical protein
VDVEASAECEAACEADARFEVECTPAEVAVALTADVPEGSQAKLDALFATLEANLPVVLEISTDGAVRLEGAASAFADAVEGVGAVVEAGARAAACTVKAVSAAASAAASIEVSVSLQLPPAVRTTNEGRSLARATGPSSFRSAAPVNAAHHIWVAPAHLCVPTLRPSWHKAPRSPGFANLYRPVVSFSEACCAPGRRERRPPTQRARCAHLDGHLDRPG